MLDEETRRKYLTLIQEPNGFFDIPEEDRTEELSFLAICHHPEIIEHIKEQSRRMVEKIVSKAPHLFRHVRFNGDMSNDYPYEYDVTLRSVKAIATNIQYTTYVPETKDYYEKLKKAAIINDPNSIFICHGINSNNIALALSRPNLTKKNAWILLDA